MILRVDGTFFAPLKIIWLEGSAWGPNVSLEEKSFIRYLKHLKNKIIVDCLASELIGIEQ